jgi:hypothetical protein
MSEHTKPRVRGDWKARFLEALAEVPVVAHAARAASIDYRQAWRTRESDPEFASAWDDAMEAGVDRAEQEAFRRGVQGYEEPVVDKGRLAYQYERYLKDVKLPDGTVVQEEAYRPVLDDRGQPVPLTIRKHSDALLSLILKGRRKKVYAERTELTGADGGPMVQQVDDTTRSARVAQLMALAEARKAGAASDDDETAGGLV